MKIILSFAIVACVLVTLSGGAAVIIKAASEGKNDAVVVLTDLAYATGIVFDTHDYLVLSESGAGRIRTYAPPYGKGPKSSFSYDGSIIEVALDSTATHIWGANQTLIVAQEFAYPDGVPENETQKENLAHPTGVALSPPESCISAETLAVAIVAASSSEAQDDPIVWLAGGPGADAITEIPMAFAGKMWHAAETRSA